MKTIVRGEAVGQETLKLGLMDMYSGYEQLVAAYFPDAAHQSFTAIFRYSPRSFSPDLAFTLKRRNMVDRSDNLIDIHLREPTPFIVSHWQSLLPDWQIPPQIIALILLKSQFSLDAEGDLISPEKDRLLYRFLVGGKIFHSLSLQRGFLGEIISPKDGTPQYSTKGELTFDLVAIVHESIGFDFSKTEEGCKVLQHPEWGTSIYPGLFVSEAPEASVQSILSEIVWK